MCHCTKREFHLLILQAQKCLLELSRLVSFYINAYISIIPEEVWTRTDKCYIISEMINQYVEDIFFSNTEIQKIKDRGPFEQGFLYLLAFFGICSITKKSVNTEKVLSQQCQKYKGLDET